MKGKGIVAAAAALLGILLIAALGVLAGRGACNSYEKVETLAAAEKETENAASKAGEEENAKLEEAPSEQETSVPATQPADETAGEPQPEEPITLLFAGDVLLSDHVLNAYNTGGGLGGVLDGNLL